MRLFYFSLIFIISANFALAKEPQWFVAVYGEHFQLVDSASATAETQKHGVFLDKDFVGKEIYVRSQEHYELDQFRPTSPSNNSNTTISIASDSAIAGSTVTPEDKTLMTTEFGPLTDTGLQYHIDGDFRGWFCANLYVTPMGGRIYKLRCDKDMRHE